MYSITISKLLYPDIIIIINLFSSNLQDVVINAQIIYDDDDDDGQINQAMMLLCTCLFPWVFWSAPINIIKCVSGADLQFTSKVRWDGGGSWVTTRTRCLILRTLLLKSVNNLKTRPPSYRIGSLFIFGPSVNDLTDNRRMW